MTRIHLDPLIDIEPASCLRTPGEVLLNDYLRPRSLTISGFARRSGIRSYHLRQIVEGRRRVTADEALRLAAVLEPTALYWVVLQGVHDLAAVRGGKGGAGAA